MKETYVIPVTELVTFAAADVIATSGDSAFLGDPDDFA